MEQTDRTRQTVIVCGILGLLTFAVYWPVVLHGFIHYDDPVYVTENARVLSGLRWGNIQWAFRTGEGGNWHPLTWVSHMLDVELFGVRAGHQHFISLLLHVASTCLLFVTLRRMTSALWASAFVAALFAVHPLHVESVAWVAERKDVLSTLFFMFTLWCYSHYAETPKTMVGNHEGQGKNRAAKKHSNQKLPSADSQAESLLWYFMALLCFALGLMSKPMLVTLPFVLLLLDFWPLQRFEIGASWAASVNQKAKTRTNHPKPSVSAGRLILEKIPFFSLAAASSYITYWVQNKGSAVSSVQALSFFDRTANACASYLKYLGKMVWPSNLVVFYPHPSIGNSSPDQWPAWQYAAAAVALAGITLLALLQCKRRPYLLVGWLWYLGTLVPVIGLVQVGTQAMADRYTYIPLIGIFIALAWWFEELFVQPAGGSVPAPTPYSRIAFAVLIAVCAVLARFQVNFWQDDFTLFNHALAVNDRNAPAHISLATVYGKQQKYGLARMHCQAALQADPHAKSAWQILGDTDVSMGKFDAALADYQQALRIDRELPYTWFSLGATYAALGKIPEAIQNYQTAIQLKPDLTAAHNNLAGVYWNAGRRDEALAEFREAVRLEPYSADRHLSLAKALAQQGNSADAVKEFTETLRLRPGFTEALSSWGAMLAAEGKWPEAEQMFMKIVAQNPSDAQNYLRLGSLYLLAGRTNEATATFTEAVRLQPNLPRESFANAKKLLAQGQIDSALAAFTLAVWLMPDNPEAHSQLGLLLAHRGKFAEAKFHFSEALRISPTAEAHYNLALSQGMQGNYAEAMQEYQAALKMNPDLPAALNDLAWIMATAKQAEIRNGAEAVRLAERACELTKGKNSGFLGTLAAAYAEAGRFSDAIATAEKTRDLALREGQATVAEKAAARLLLYRDGKPLRE